MSNKIAVAALSAVLAMSVTTQALADKTSKEQTNTLEKCYGIVKAGKNDCASKTMTCAAQSKTDSDKDAWISVPKGTCNKIVGGSTTEG